MKPKPKPKKPNLPFAIYLSTFNSQSSAVTEATRAWASERMTAKKRFGFAR